MYVSKYCINDDITEVHNLFCVARVECTQVSNTENNIYLTRLYLACGSILLPSELFLNIISCKIVSISMKFKFIHKIAIIQEKFRILFNLLRGPDMTRSGAGSGPWGQGCASLLYNVYCIIRK